MEKIAHQPEPAAYPAILLAFHTALQLPEWKHSPLRIGICDRDGDLAAVGVLNDFRQMRLFTIHMEAMGYRQLILGTPDELKGCDVLYTPQCWQHASMTGRTLMAAAA